MNKTTRARLHTLNGRINEIHSELEEIGEEEQDKFNNLPESLQESPQGEALNDSVDSIEYAAVQASELWHCVDDCTGA
jgi:hypothetical protein